ncbi:hypothetical protein AN944_01025 [Shewanella sp. P1-14-1]|nr:hypothetical protein AN944_01025 [Shewanella sp. P1-14-1]
MYMKLVENSKFVLLMTVGSFALVALMLFLGYVDDPRFADNELTNDEMYWWERILLIQGVVCAITLWACSSFHCFKFNSKLLAIIIFVVWPLAYLYSWVIAIMSSMQTQANKSSSCQL